MSMEIVTGYVGGPHITSQQDRFINQACIGTGNYILPIGSQLEPTIVSNTLIELADGGISLQGCVGINGIGETQEVTIMACSSGFQRIDYISAHYSVDSDGKESLNIIAETGTAVTSDPVPPTSSGGSIENGDTSVWFPLFQVNINGPTIESVEMIASVAQTNAEQAASLTSLLSTINSRTKFFSFSDSDDYDTQIATVTTYQPFVFMGLASFSYTVLGIGTGSTPSFGIGCKYGAGSYRFICVANNKLYYVTVTSGGTTTYKPLDLQTNV